MATSNLFRRALALSRTQDKRAPTVRVFWRELGHSDAEWAATPDGRSAAEAERAGALVIITMWLPATKD